MSEWVPQGWAPTAFGELFDYKGGSQPPKSTFFSEPAAGLIRLLQIRDFGSDEKAVYIQDDPKWAKCSEKDIMIGRYGASVGKILGGKSGAYNVALVRWIFDEENLDVEWVRRLLQSDIFQLPLQKVSRSAQDGFNKGDLAGIELPLPPLAEQRRIARKLDTLSTRTTTARTHLSAIKSLVERYKSAVIIAIFSQFSSSDYITTLDKVGKLICGQSPSSSTVNKEGRGKPYCTGPEQWDGEKVHLDKWTTDPKKIVSEKSIFITVKGSGVGTLFQGVNCAIGRDIYAYVPDLTVLESGFAFWALRYEIANILLKAKGLIPGLSKPDILNNPVYVPSKEEQREIVLRIETAFAKIDRLAAEAERALKLIDRLDQRILAKAFAGELVSQDPTDEPAAALLARIRADREAAPKAKRGRKMKA